ncbi:MAG: hypothetical protein GXP27_21475 [Planctomycetes bacterium]|nr:hypothetical protein [Planctomycetota bacterium]
MSSGTARPSLLRRLYTDNPFYVISAVLMAYAVLQAYGELEIGTINCWIMMSVLAAYTSVLAAIAVLIVRYGKVWDDARSLLLLLVVLFLAVSVSADDLFVKMTSAQGGIGLLVGGYLFSAIVSEVVLRGTGIRLGWLYRIPYHMTLVLFYVAPWWCAPQLHPRSYSEGEWTLTLFPVAAAAIALCLLPAARRGPAYTADDGPPWPWPAYPWSLFIVLVCAVAFRSFILCMTYGPRGPIWTHTTKGFAISFDTIWGPYFLVPLGLAILVVLLELGLTTDNLRFQQGVLKKAPLLLLLAVPIGGDLVFPRFLRTVVETIGSPVWLTVWLLLAFYVWAWIRRVPGAVIGTAAMCLLLALIGPETIDPRSLVGPYPWPFLVAAVLLLIEGLRRASSGVCTASAASFVLGLWYLLPQTVVAGYRFSICYHVLWLAVVVLGFVYQDRMAKALLVVGAAQMPLASFVVAASPVAAQIPFAWRLSYVLLLVVCSLAIAKVWRNRWYFYAFGATSAVAFYQVTVLGFRRAVDSVGRPAMTALAWSLGMLLLAFLISAHKARWLPERLFPQWPNRPEGASDELVELQQADEDECDQGGDQEKKNKDEARSETSDPEKEKGRPEPSSKETESE